MLAGAFSDGHDVTLLEIMLPAAGSAGEAAGG
jgi:hypothetical protein